MAWSGKVVIVTGSTSGIGQATALLFGRAGAMTVLHGQSKDRLQKTLEYFKKAEIPESRVHHVLGPIDNEKFQKQLIDETVQKFGKLNVLVSNAGTASLSGSKPTSVETYDHVMRVNVRSNFTLLPLALPHLIKSKGNVVIVSSIASRIAEPTMNPYQMSKSAVDRFAQNVAIEYVDMGVRVNAVSPGLIETNLGSAYGVPPEKMHNVYRKYVQSRIPLKRMGHPEEVANVIEFLASDEASYVNGVLYDIDGGQFVARGKLKKTKA